ncbi:hypothetical protein GCM10009534_00900 [Kribbella sandramycini]
MVVLVGCLVLAVAVVGGMGWAAVSVARHRVGAAADLAALSAAYAVGADPCGVAARVAAANGAVLAECVPTGSEVTVRVGCEVRLPWGLATQVMGQARAGPGAAG